MSPREIAELERTFRRGLDSVRIDLIGRSAEVVGRPEIAGEVIAVSLNPQGVVIVTLKAKDTTKERNPHAKTWPLRLRLPAGAMRFGEPVEPPARKRKPTFAKPPIARANGVALDHQGRLAI